MFEGEIKRFGAPGRARTCDLLIRSQTLYPTELRVHEGDGKREEEIVQMGSERFIGQFPFLIFHFPFGDHTYRVSLKNGKWKMRNGK
jgi:hypothetical protein